MRNISKNRRYAIFILIFGLLLSGWVLFFSPLPAASDFLSAHSASWVDKTGDGFSAPACGSSTPSTSCVDASNISVSLVWDGNSMYQINDWQVLIDGNVVCGSVACLGTAPGGSNPYYDPIWTGIVSNVPHTYEIRMQGAHSESESVTTWSSFNTGTLNPLSCTSPDPTGTIQGFKGSGAWPIDVNATPPKDEAVTLDGVSSVTANPYFFSDTSAGNHTVSVNVPIDWTVGYTLCYNSTTCHDNTPTPGNSVNVNVPAGGYADLWWHYQFLPPLSVTLSVTINAGSGVITGPGINCPGDCSETYPSDTWITLIATPSLGYSFTDWVSSGPGSICAGQGSACSALMDADKTASVNFGAEAPPNSPPVVNAGPDQTITYPSSASLNGVITDDGRPNPPGVVTALWSKVSGPGIVAFDNNTSAVTTANFSTAGVYILRLTGSDSVLSSLDNVTITVGTPLSVVCWSSPATASLGETVTWTADVSGDAPPFAYSWSGTSIPTSPPPDTNQFSISYSTIGRKTATVTVTNSASPPVQKECEANIQINFNPDFEEF